MQAITVTLILLPFLAALSCYSIRSGPVRSGIILTTGCILIGSSLLLIPHVPFMFSPETVFGLDAHGLIQIPDFILMFAVLYYGIKHRSILVIVPASLQIVLITWFELFMIEEHPTLHAFYCVSDYSEIILAHCRKGFHINLFYDF